MPTDPEELKLLVDAMERRRTERTREFPAEELPNQTALLRKLYALLVNGAESTIAPGDLVIWKEGMKNRKRPLYKEPAIVISVTDDDQSHIDPTQESGSAYYREPLTLQLGVIDEDGELSLFYFDKRRFQPFHS